MSIVGLHVVSSGHRRLRGLTGDEDFSNEEIPARRPHPFHWLDGSDETDEVPSLMIPMRLKGYVGEAAEYNGLPVILAGPLHCDAQGRVTLPVKVINKDGAMEEVVSVSLLHLDNVPAKLKMKGNEDEQCPSEENAGKMAAESVEKRRKEKRDIAATKRLPIDSDEIKEIRD